MACIRRKGPPSGQRRRWRGLRTHRSELTGVVGRRRWCLCGTQADPPASGPLATRQVALQTEYPTLRSPPAGRQGCGPHNGRRASRPDRARRDAFRGAHRARVHALPPITAHGRFACALLPNHHTQGAYSDRDDRDLFVAPAGSHAAASSGQGLPPNLEHAALLQVSSSGARTSVRPRFLLVRATTIVSIHKKACAHISRSHTSTDSYTTHHRLVRRARATQQRNHWCAGSRYSPRCERCGRPVRISCLGRIP